MKSPIISITITLAIIAAIIGGFFIISEQQGAEIAKLREDIIALDDKFTVLLENNESLSTKISDEEAKRKLLEEQQEALRTEFSTLESEEAASIVSRWEPFVYKLSCTFTVDDGKKTVGSAIVEHHRGKLRFITNEHVLEKNDELPTICTLTKPDDDSVEVDVAGNNIIVEEDIDFGYGTFSATIMALSNGKRCSTTPDIGDSVIILGYPRIGATNSITATEGIISGFEDKYYITSAKIDKGNSGGAAIHVKNDCLLGMPTLAIAGRVESLARILPLQ